MRMNGYCTPDVMFLAANQRFIESPSLSYGTVRTALIPLIRILVSQAKTIQDEVLQLKLPKAVIIGKQAPTRS